MDGRVADDGLTELVASVITDDEFSPRHAVVVWSRSAPGERGAAVGGHGESGLFGRLTRGPYHVAIPVFELSTVDRKGDRFAFGLFCRAIAVVNVALPVNAFDSGAISQGLFTPRGCVGKGRGRAGATLATCILFQVFVSSVRFIGRSGVPGHADFAWLVCWVRLIDLHASPARCPRSVASAFPENAWILATVHYGPTSRSRDAPSCRFQHRH